MLADLCSYWIMAFAMLTQDQLRLFSKIFKVRHIGLHDEIVGGHCPSARLPLHPTCEAYSSPIASDVVRTRTTPDFDRINATVST